MTKLPFTKFSWAAYPMWRLLLPYLVGIVIANQLHYTTPGTWGWIIWLIGSLLLLVILPRPIAFRWRYILGIGITAWVLTFAYLHTSQQYAPNHALHLNQQLTHWQDQELYALGTVITARRGTDRTRVTVALQQLQLKDSLQPIHTNVAVSIPTDSSSLSLHLGHTIAFHGRIQAIKPPTNPDVFDYAAWQARQQVFHQVYLQGDDWQILSRKLSLKGWAEAKRANLLRILYRYLGDHPNEYAVTAALVLGKRDAVSKDLRNAYAETGAIHVLAVSGLHLGFVLGALHILLGWGFWDKPRWRWPRLVLILIGIWLFALLTGLAPSVLRAATMFSFLEIGRQLKRKSSTYNALAASAFLLLLLDPQLLFNIGFQLSYLAVLGILFFQPRIVSLLYFSNKFAQSTWALIALALAAQLTTFPLSLYYFHQFPVYFLLTGVFAVLLAGIILYLAAGVLLISWWSSAAALLAKLLYWAVFLNNALIFGVQKLPFGLIRAVWISGAIVGLLYLSQLLFAQWLHKRQAKTLLSFLASLVVVLALYNWNIAKRSQQTSTIVYDLRRASAVDWMNGSQAFTSMLKVDDKLIDYQLSPHREHRSIKDIRQLGADVQYPHIWRNGPALAFRQQRWFLLDSDHPLPQAPNKLEVDAVLLRENPRFKLAQLQQSIHAQTWVADGSNAYWRVRQWQAEADSLKLNFHHTSQHGAYILDVNKR